MTGNMKLGTSAHWIGTPRRYLRTNNSMQIWSDCLVFPNIYFNPQVLKQLGIYKDRESPEQWPWGEGVGWPLFMWKFLWELPGGVLHHISLLNQSSTPKFWESARRAPNNAPSKYCHSFATGSLFISLLWLHPLGLLFQQAGGLSEKCEVLNLSATFYLDFLMKKYFYLCLLLFYTCRQISVLPSKNHLSLPI